MAKIADRGKHNILDECDVEVIEKTVMPPTKKLKQARLPFHPIVHKVQKDISPQNLKKRKLSDPESPSAKTQKIINKTLADKSKHDKHTDKVVKLLDKGKHDLVSSEKHDIIIIDGGNDHEVSSSSEAENQPLCVANRRRASGSNLLERFVKKSPQEEISSTNEVVDLTDSDEERVVVVSSTKEVPTSKNDVSVEMDDKSVAKTELDSTVNSVILCSPNGTLKNSSLDRSAETDKTPSVSKDVEIVSAVSSVPSTKSDGKITETSETKFDSKAEELHLTVIPLPSSKPDGKTEVSSVSLGVENSHIQSAETDKTTSVSKANHIVSDISKVPSRNSNCKTEVESSMGVDGSAIKSTEIDETESVSIVEELHSNISSLPTNKPDGKTEAVVSSVEHHDSTESSNTKLVTKTKELSSTISSPPTSISWGKPVVSSTGSGIQSNETNRTELVTKAKEIHSTINSPPSTKPEKKMETGSSVESSHLQSAETSKTKPVTKVKELSSTISELPASKHDGKTEVVSSASSGIQSNETSKTKVEKSSSTISELHARKSDGKTEVVSSASSGIQSNETSKTKSVTKVKESSSTINELPASKPDGKTDMVVSTLNEGSHLESSEDKTVSITESSKSVNTETDMLVSDQVCQKDVAPSSDVTEEVVEVAETSAVKTDAVCQHSSNEDDHSDLECLDGSLLDTSVCSIVKSDESFSDTPLSTSTSSSKQSPKLVTSTPRNKPRSLKMSELKKQEKEAARKEKLQMRLEKIKQKEEERLQKEKLKQEKAKKEKEKKAQLEQERLEKIQHKEEEKKKKQELLDAKFEEKKKKEEEKRLKDEERQKEEDEKIKKKQKAQQAFSSFFIKQKVVTAKTKEVISSLFMPFEVKTGMILAPIQRRKLGEDEVSHLDECLKKQDLEKLYVNEVTEKDYKSRTDSRTIVPKPAYIPDVEVIETDLEVKKVTYPAKFLSFHTNYRPPYFGTWRKSSKVLTARNPFKKDSNLFDYEVDSDDEWEEEEPGESLENSEGEEEKEGEEEEEEEEDGWMVPHGYLSEDEICEEDEEVTPAVLKARQMAKADAWEAEMKRQCQPVDRLVIGCFWDGETPSDNKSEKLQQFKVVCLCSVIPIPMTNDDTLNKDSENGTPNRSGLKKPVPEEAIPYLIQLVHGNTLGIKKLVKEFRLFWKQKNEPKQDNDTSEEIRMDVDAQDSLNKTATFDESITEDKSVETGLNETKESFGVFSISKRQLEKTISSIAVRQKRQDKKICWFVHENVLEQYGCQGISLPSTWQYVSNVKKPPKVSDECGRKTPKDFGTEMICEENLECGQSIEKNAKDQRSIMDFARKNMPVVIKEIEKPATPVGKNTNTEKPDITAAISTDTTPIKTLPNDQRSITDFTKKGLDTARNHLAVTSPLSVPASSFVTPKPAKNSICNMLKNTPKTSRKSLINCLKSPKSVTSPVRVTDKVPEGVLKPLVSSLNPVILQHISPVEVREGEIIMETDISDKVSDMKSIISSKLKPIVLDDSPVKVRKGEAIHMETDICEKVHDHSKLIVSSKIDAIVLNSSPVAVRKREAIDMETDIGDKVSETKPVVSSKLDPVNILQDSLVIIREGENVKSMETDKDDDDCIIID